MWFLTTVAHFCPENEFFRLLSVTGNEYIFLQKLPWEPTNHLQKTTWKNISPLKRYVKISTFSAVFAHKVSFFDHFRWPEVNHFFSKITSGNLSNICKKPHANISFRSRYITVRRRPGIVFLLLYNRKIASRPSLTKTWGKCAKMVKFQFFLRETPSNRLNYRM